MFEPLNSSLKKIARGTGVALVGMTLGLLFAFITRLIIARYGLQADYGIFSLALVVLNFAAGISALGLRRGATRYIAYFRGQDKQTEIRKTMSAAFQICAVASIVVGLALFFSAEAIAIAIFHTSDLVSALKIFAVGLPFMALTGVLSSFFRGFDKVEPGIIFQNIVLHTLILIFLLIVVGAHLPFVAIFHAYLAALITTFIAFTIYGVKRLPQRMDLINVRATAPIAKDVLLFSLPLLGSAILMRTIMHIGTLMLGYFKTPELVGLYNAAYPLAIFISEPLVALRLIYTPVATGLYSQNRMPELRKNYTILTKWLASITLPIFLVLAMHPGAVLYLFFGHDYLPAATTLRILSIGFIISNLLGPNGATLIALGHSRFIMWATLATTIITISLNIVLIPPLGITGVAIAAVVSISVVNIIHSVRLYSLCQAQPLSKNMFKPVIISVILALLIQILVRSFLDVSWWMLPIFFIFYCVIYGLAMLFTKSFDKEDIALLLEIEKRSGIKATPIKKLLSRFL